MCVCECVRACVCVCLSVRVCLFGCACVSSAVLKAAWSSLLESAGILSKQMEERARNTEAEVRLEQARQTAAVSSEGSRRTRQGN